MLTDSGTEIDEEFLELFIEESLEVIKNLKSFVKELKDPLTGDIFENYGQQIDRIMGTAFTLSLNFIGEITKMGKEIAYKSKSISDSHKLLSIHSLLSQLIKSLEKIVMMMSVGEQPNYDDFSHLKDRLVTANENLGKIWASLA